jgi:Ca-activated chloride channel homolog
MKEIISDILNDLYELDPELKKEEDHLKKIINRLLSSQPRVEINEDFKTDLKKRLLKEINKKHKKSSWFSIPKLSTAAGIFSLIFTVIILNTVFEPFSIKDKETNNISVVQIDNDKNSITDETGETSTGHIDFLTEKSGANEEQFLFENDRDYKDSFAGDISNMDDAPAPVILPDSTERFNGTDKERLLDLQEVEKDFNTEEYARIYENQFLSAITNPLSTFSIDVDTASYSNVRRQILYGNMPYPDSVRIEELINYFTYDYPEPENNAPFSFNTEISECPWNTEHRLFHIGLQAKKVSFENLPPNNLVFLIDVSGSMEDENKLPLLKGAFELLINELRSVDRISIVVYAGAAGLVLPPTTCNNKETILTALNNLNAGGSTAGGEGLILAYDTALKYYNPLGNNRIILATDGDFNVGPSSDSEMTRLIEDKRNQGIFITVLGFGMGNYKDTKMESIADHGNGNYAYIDSLKEAKKVLVSEMGGTLLTIAKDVKIQIEFNPALVESYRLIGYENRMLAKEDFDDDTKDAGELGAGHTVTALYEIIPVNESAITDDHELRYQQTEITENAYSLDELLLIKFRYKKPDSDISTLIEIPVKDSSVPLMSTSNNFRFSAAVAEWGLLLRGSEFKADATYNQVIELAESSTGSDLDGYRKEFIDLVTASKQLDTD